jgi:hypothetical protein
MSHLAERFGAAVLTLVGDGPVKERLGKAYAEHLEGIADTELPAGLREPFAGLTAALNRRAPIGAETRVGTNVRKMSPVEAADHAVAIVKLYVELVLQGERAEPLKVVSTGKAPPRYLTQRP